MYLFINYFGSVRIFGETKTNMLKLTEFQRKHFVMTGRCGKSAMMLKYMNQYLDESPTAKVYIAKSDGSCEVIENAEFEEVTNWIPAQAESTKTK